MKKLLSMLALILAVVCIFTSCNSLPGTPTDKEDIITIEDGYLVVNGKKTEYKVDTPDVIEIIDGYVVVNGVKTDIFVPTCNHSWTTVTTAPTCTADGYDTLTCSLCGKSITQNETAKLDHTYSTTYSFDDNNHWFTCTGCDSKKDEAAHTPDDDGICTVCQMPTSATPGVIYDISADGTYAEVIGYEGTATKVKIASVYKGLPVTNIYSNAFKDNTKITNVIIPDSITSISSAFSGCSSLTSVTIPDSVTTISGAFYNCTSLTEVVIGTGVKNIEYNTFFGCVNIDAVYTDDITKWCEIDFRSNPLEYANKFFVNNKLVSDLVIPNGVINIGEGAFKGYDGLKTVIIPDSVKIIGSSAFDGCRNLVNVEIGDDVTKIGDYAFRDCNSLTNIVIGENVESIGWYTFDGCNNLVVTEYDGCHYIGSEKNPYHILLKASDNYWSTYNIHENTIIIGATAFYGCSRLNYIEIPEGVKYIGYRAFGNTKLSSIVLPQSLKVIGGYAFECCGQLESVIIENGLTTIEWGAFNNCNNLYNIYYTGTAEDWEKISITYMSNEGLDIATIHYNYVPEE